MGKRGLGDACGFQGTLLFPSVNGIPSPEHCLRDGAGRGGMLLILQEMGRERSAPGFWERKMGGKKRCSARRVWDGAAAKLGKGKEGETGGRTGVGKFELAMK